jgi:hypothetical protein
VYQWKLNGNNVGTSSTTYTNTALANNDVVSVVLTANNVCQATATAAGNNITTTVTNQNNYYLDQDSDGFGGNTVLLSCSMPIGYVMNSVDCNDLSNSINPSQYEICGNSIDENCDGIIETCLGDVFNSPILATNIKTYGTGVQYISNLNLSSATNSVQSPGSGNDVWFKFVAESNAIRIALTGNSTVLDNNSLMLFNDPSNPNVTTQLIPISTENDVAPGNVGTLGADGGSETLLFDQLTIGNTYYLCVQNLSTPSTCSLTMGWLRSSTADIMPYTNYTGIYTNTCQNFKAKFRSGAAQYIVNRWTSSADLGNGLMPSYTYAIPPGSSLTTASTVCQLGRISVANLGTLPVTYYVSVDVLYNLKDAFGNTTPLSAYATSISSFVLNPELDLNVRESDRCPVYKSATNGALATNRSVCGANRYEWNLTQTFPLTSLPISLLGPVGGSRILVMNTIPGITQGQKYLAKIRINHLDGISNSNFGSSQCFQTIGAAGIPTVEEGGVIADRSENGVTTSIYPNPNSGQSVNLAVSGMEGDLNVRITDATGRMVYTNRYIVEGSLNTTFSFGQPLEGGIYMVELLQNGELKTMRMVIAK